MVELFCPSCKKNLQEREGGYICNTCNFVLKNNNGVLVNSSVLESIDKDFYDKIYESEHGHKWLQGLNRDSSAKRILEKVSLSYRRERFFKRNIKGNSNVILDLACGAGRDYFKQFGAVIGVDLSYSPLQQAKQRYDAVIQSGCDALPFADSTFDYVVSSDFFGHVRAEDKDKIIREILRVLKPGGTTLHVIETDSDNIWFKIAHENPELFQKYFVEKIGGHVGLEMPVDCVKRWQKNGFEVIKADKIWGTIWPIKDYASLFDNEYRQKSAFVSVIVTVSKILGKIKAVEILTNIILNPINSLVEFSTGLNHGNGLMLAGRKSQQQDIFV
jgi:ubiquinone/menaquinone biosynthesis C-methylase UbiE